MQPFRGPPPPPPRGFPGAMAPPIAGVGGAPPHMRPPPMVVGGGGVMPPRGGMMAPPRGGMMAPPRGGPMMFAPPSMGPPRGMALPPRGMGPGPRGPMLFGAHGVVAAGPPGVGISSAPPPPGTVDIPVPVVELPDSGPMNVFVGKLPPDLHDNYIRQLLEKCGTVVTWKRTTDPVTDKPKGFGYCTFATAHDVLRALRLLNGFAVDTREILLKVDSKTQTKLDVVTKAMTEKMKLEEQERDNEIKQSLMNLSQMRSGRMGGQQNDVATWGDLLEKKTTADEQDQQQQNGVQGVDNGSDGAGGEHDKPDSGDQSGETRSASSDAPVEGQQIRGTMIMREVEKFRLAQEQREQEQEQKRREAILERLRREKEDEEKRRAADERRKAADDRRRAAEEKRKAEEEAARIAKAEAAVARKKDRENRGDDNGEYDSETDEREDGGRKKSSSSRRRDREDRDRDRDRKKRSTRERSRDRDRERKRGRDHRSRSRSKSRERSSRRRRHRKSGSRSRSRTRSRSRHRGDRERDRESRRKRRHRRDSSADRYRSDDDEERKRSSKRTRDSAKIKAVDGDDDGVAERDETRSEEAGSPSKIEGSSSQSPLQPEIPAVVEAPKPAVMPKVVLGLKMASANAKKEKPVTIPAVSAFVVEEEVEAKPLRELVPIDYTEEEKLAGASVQQRVAATVARINSRSGDVKSLIEQIPTETAELFAYPIDWRAVDQNKIVQEKMEPWVKKKIVEYLGEDEPTLTEFLLKKLDQRAPAQEILSELQLVLDDDAEVFVKLLWRKLAFEAVRVSSQ